MKLLVFDMGHVFVDFDWTQVAGGFARRAGSLGETALKSAFVELAHLGYESGQISTADFLGELNRILGTSLSLAEFTEIWTLTFRENEEMAALLTHLKQQIPLYLLSNTNEIHYGHLQQNYQVDRHFNELILSYKVGCCKPDFRIYEEVVKRSGLAYDECLFVDDLEPNIKAAKLLGMHTVHFKGIEDLKSRLPAFGLTV